MPTPTGEPFAHMDLAAAQAECGRPKVIIFDICKKCDQKVGLHCDSCKIQVTGCLCTELERFGENEGIQRIFDKLGEDAARARLAKMGIVVPRGFGNSN